ncbi:unnamed protein product [Rhizoctonia solani]|uniref:IMS import disulfide relay-system CHCH-CHCH-like Cx9C domain-containing protein n=1 Tax=Rhizoctonia solani TaxID=456999 RepID=A0A8H3EAF1_9AGAM|nr:unnamed protein product [Rhizoctonia solani]CAE7195143.1 unnamed protein product [Rhizoctonia solani]
MRTTPTVLGALGPAGPDSRPILKLAQASKSCTAPAKAYGQCMLASYQDARKDMCNAEFIEFKNCVQAAMGRKW